jgi:hypothetical protein
MNSRLILFVALVHFFTSGPARSQDSEEAWQRKAIKDFPELGIKDSALNSAFLAKVAELKRTDPRFFRDTRWPYTLAEQLTKKSVIPGLAPVAPVTIPDRPRSVFVNGARANLVEAGDLETAGQIGQVAVVKGQIEKVNPPKMGREETFFVHLKPNVICEFPLNSFIPQNSNALRRIYGFDFFSLQNSHEPKLAFERGGVSVNSRKNMAGFSRVKPPYEKLGAILKAGETVVISGRFVGPGAVGLERGIMLKDCLLQHHD